MANDVTIRVGAETNEAKTGLDRLDSSVNNFAKKATASFGTVKNALVGLFAFDLIKGFFEATLDEFGRVQDLADRFGESAESIQRVGQAAKLNGSDVETLATAMQKATVNALGAAENGGELADAFKTLGIDAAAFVDLPLEEKLMLLADGYNQGQSNAEKLNATLKILGKSGAELAPLLSAGPDALKEALDGANVASNDTVKILAETGDKVDHIVATFKVWGAYIAGYLISAFEGVGGLAAMVSAYVSNLPKGFAAAKEAADLAFQGFAEQINESRATDNEDNKGKTKVVSSEEAEEAKKAADEAKKQLDERQKYTDDLLKMQEDNRKKEREIYLESLKTAEKRALVEKEIAELKNRQKNAERDPLQQANLRGQELDKQKELASLVKKQEDDAKKAAEDRVKQEQKIKEEKAKASIETAKDRLEKAKTAAGDTPTFDSLRRIGGGLANVNYTGSAKVDTLRQQELQTAKQQLEKLENILKELQKDKDTPTFNDGSVPI